MIEFIRANFYPIKNTINNFELSLILKKNLLQETVFYKNKINNVSSLENITDKSFIFLKKNTKIINFDLSNCSIITDDKIFLDKKDCLSIHLVSDIDKSYNLILNNLYFHEDNEDCDDEYTIVKGSFVANSSVIHQSTNLGKNCLIGRGVVIGKNCIIKNNVVIKNTIIGDNVIIGDNTTIGSTGFGFDLKNMGSLNISPHIGIVHIDDNVSIGSNCTIDRGKIDITYLGKNSMLDNLVHIAHNVILKQNVCIAAQVGISGSTIIGKNVVIGGQTGFAGHIEIGDNVIVAAKSGVTKNIQNNSTVAGFPAIDINNWKKNIINAKKYRHK